MASNRKGKDKQKLPFVSVILPVYNAESTVSTAIKALLQQDYPSEKMEIIVVDDGSSDRSRGIVSRYPVKLVCHDYNKGVSAAINTGARNAIGEILMTTDADDRVCESWVRNLVEGYEDSDVGTVVGSSHVEYDVKNWRQRTIAQLYVCAYGGRKVTRIHDRYGRMSRSGKSVGTNQSFRKSVFEAVRGFDTTLSAGEDHDILWRVEQMGYRIAFKPEAIVYVHPRPSIRDYIKQAYHRASGGIAMYRKHPSKMGIRYLFNAGFVPILVVLLTLGFLLKIAPLLYLSLVILVSPLVFYLVQLMKVRQYIQKTKDAVLVLMVGYIGFFAVAIGIIRGIWGYMFRPRVRA